MVGDDRVTKGEIKVRKRRKIGDDAVDAGTGNLLEAGQLQGCERRQTGGDVLKSSIGDLVAKREIAG